MPQVVAVNPTILLCIALIVIPNHGSRLVASSLRAIRVEQMTKLFDFGDAGIVLPSFA